MIDLTQLRQDAMAALEKNPHWANWEFSGNAHEDGISPSTAIALIEAVEAAKASLERHAHMAAICRTELSPEDAALREALKPFTKE